MPFSTYPQRSWHEELHRALETVANSLSSNVASAISSLTIGHASSSNMALASVSSHLAARQSTVTRTTKRPDNEAVGFLAASPAEIKARLAGVPIYAVVNAKKEFILVSGDDDYPCSTYCGQS